MKLRIIDAPKADESIMGYILRLTELNGYETPLWVLTLANPECQEIHRAYELVFGSCERIDHLGRILGVGAARLNQLIHPRTTQPDNASLFIFFGQIVPDDAVRPMRPKVCPGCLSESPYCQRVWEFTAITVCPKHRRLLINECPKCNRRISWSRKKVTVCSCKFDWRESSASPMIEQELRLTRHISQVCGLSVAEADPLKIPGPISRLSLNDLLRVLFFIAGQQRGLSAATSRHLVAAEKSKSFHSILTEAYSIFDNWPVNYFGFLDQRRVHEQKVTRTYQRMKSALYGEFGSFYSGLHNVLSGSQFDFMRGAFIEYITQNRMRNCLPDPMGHKMVEGSLQSQYILKSDVRRLLGVDYAWINHHIATGRLRTAVRSKGKKRLVFIKAGDVARLVAGH